MDREKNDIFRFAHLSDPHLSSLADVKIPDLLNKRALGYLSWRLRRRRKHSPEVLAALRHDLRGLTLDHIVITGDLTHIGLPSEFQQARRWLETLGSPADVTVVPGNHDAYVRASWDTTFALWTPHMVSDPGLSARAIPPPADSIFPAVRKRGCVALIGVSSARPSAPFLAVGSLRAVQLERLDRILGDLRQEKLFRVLLIHHPPMVGIVSWRKRLTDAAALRSVMVRHSVELVLHGHAHRMSVTRCQAASSSITAIGVPSATASGSKPGHRAQYHLYEVRPTPAGWDVRLSVRIYSPQIHGFLAKDEFVLTMQRP
jgi:3',5'-cyclic AMP phosphodiesterase CpdA